jgi:hypothetical protein
MSLLNDVAYPESPSDVITVCNRSHLTYQEHHKFWAKVKYPACSKPKDDQLALS